MSLYLRQVALVASKLAPVIDDLSAIFGIEPCHVDPGVGIWGLENTLIPVGSNFLEVVAPIKDGTAAGRHIARRGGDGGYMVICQTESRDSQRAFREHAVAAGVRVAYEGDGYLPGRNTRRAIGQCKSSIHKDSRRARSGAVRRRCRCQRP